MEGRLSGGNGSILALLKSHFGYDQFRPLQEEIITNVLAKKDTLVLMPTGGGKSLCYQLPALCFDGITLVVSPLIALMKDQVDALKANGIAAEFINSALSPAEIDRVCAQARKGQTKILYLAPERLALSGFRNFLRTLRLSLIAIDEAHCISEWGHEFRPEYRNLKTLRRDFPAVPIIALTATATEKVRADILTQLDVRRAGAFLSSFNRPNLTYLVQPKGDAFSGLIALLQRHRNEPTIIYCFSRKDTESLAADLSREGFKALPYHAGLDNSVRNEAQEKFSRDEVTTIVATIAFGMGIDKPDIRLVVHYDLPKSLEGYYQQTGRAGRDGLPSECVLFYSYSDKMKQDFFINQIEDAAERQNAQQKLAQMVQFCELSTCRRRFLLEYFGEKPKEEGCGGCDVCLKWREKNTLPTVRRTRQVQKVVRSKPVERRTVQARPLTTRPLAPEEEFDATEIAQKVLSAVIRTGERFGESHISKVLRGTSITRAQRHGHDQLSVYGIARDFTRDDLKEIIELLLAKGLLVKDGERRTLAVTQAGRIFLKRRDKLTLAKPRADAQPALAQSDTYPKYDKVLFEELRALRKRLADAKDVRPFVIFYDVTLQEMATYLPQSRQSFSRILGVGTAKLEQFGEEFLAVIHNYARQQGLPEHYIPEPRRERNHRALQPGSTFDETRRLVLQKLPIREIAERRGLTESTIISHMERLVMAGEKLDLDYLMPPPERLAKIASAFEASGDFNLTPVRILLSEEFSYEEIRLVRLHLRQKQGPAR